MVFVSRIIAENPMTNQIAHYIDTISILNCESIDEANIWRQTNGKGYMNIIGIFNEEIPFSDLLINKIKK